MYGTDELKYTCMFWVRGTDQLKKYEVRFCIRKLKQHVLVCVRGTGHLKLYILVEYVLWIFARNSVYLEVRFHDCAALMMKDHPTMVTPSIAHQSSVSADHSNQYTLQGISFLLGCIGFLERWIAPSASRRSHKLCCGNWFMSSAWSFALATQTALAALFCTRSCCDFV